MQETINYEVVQSAEAEWAVEGIDFVSEGEVLRTLFIGRDAKQRAEEYADWKNRQEYRPAA